MRTALFGLLTLLVLSAPAPVRSEEGIVYLHLRFDSGGVTLEKARVASGTLKRSAKDSGADRRIVFEVLDGEGRILHSGRLADPRSTSVETFHEDGTISRVERKLPTAVAVIRLPYQSQARSIRFSESARPGEKAEPARLGSLRLDLHPPAPDE